MLNDEHTKLLQYAFQRKWTHEAEIEQRIDNRAQGQELDMNKNMVAEKVY